MRATGNGTGGLFRRRPRQPGQPRIVWATNNMVPTPATVPTMARLPVVQERSGSSGYGGRV